MASINAGTGIVNTGDNSGVLDIQGGGVTGVSVNANGMYVKSVTTTQMIALTAVNGMIVFNTTLAKMCQYVNGAWQQMTSVTVPSGTQRAIFGFGSPTSSTVVSTTNLVSNTGVVGNNVTGVGSARMYITAATYGGDKAIFGYGSTTFAGSAYTAITNRVSNTGVVAGDTTGVGTIRRSLAATGYGEDRAIFGYGFNGSNLSMTNLVSNTGVVGNDVTGVGTARTSLAAAKYGTLGQALFGYGNNGSDLSMTNRVSNTGVVSTDTAGVGTARTELAAAGYGFDKAIFGYGSIAGSLTSITNLVSNTGTVATNTTGVGTIRQFLAAAGYGGDKAIFGYGGTGGGLSATRYSVTNLVSNTGVVATDTTGVGTARFVLAAAGYSTT